MGALRAVAAGCAALAVACGIAMAQTGQAPGPPVASADLAGAAADAAAVPDRTAAPASAGSSAVDPLIEPPGFTYKVEGRRDPFVSLLRRGSEAQSASTGVRPGGLAGLGVNEIVLRGIIRSPEGFVGIVQGADKKNYIVRAGDKLFDGTVRTISQTDMLVMQQVDDPLSRERQREVRKVLRQIEAN